MIILKSLLNYTYPSFRRSQLGQSKMFINAKLVRHNNMSLLVVVLLIFSLASSENLEAVKFPGADCFHSRTSKEGVCVHINYCEFAKKEFNKNILPETCRFEDDEPIVCCPLEKKSSGSAEFTSEVRFDGADCFHERSKKNGVCVFVKYCDVAIKEVKKKITPEICRIENRLPIVCCPIEITEEEEDVVNKASKISSAEEKCQEYSESTRNLLYDRSDLQSADRIIGGENASLGDFPHFASIGYEANGKLNWLCGGSLISENFVLTAAHCLNDPPKAVRFGEIDSNSPNFQIFSIKKIYKHPNYRASKVYDDIGLLELASKVTFTPLIKPACLETKLEAIYPKLVVCGFGIINEDGDSASFLQKVTVDYFPTDECKQKYSRVLSTRFPKGILEESQICYGSRINKQDSCPGDSGGPLQKYDRNINLHKIVGIVSFGRGCGTVGTPGIYTKVSNYIDWIEKTVWKDD